MLSLKEWIGHGWTRMNTDSNTVSIRVHLCSSVAPMPSTALSARKVPGRAVPVRGVSIGVPRFHIPVGIFETVHHFVQSGAHVIGLFPICRVVRGIVQFLG